MRHISPLRYPGGKAGFTGFLADVIELNDLHDCCYVEPFAGGAGAALNLLRDGTVREVWINDADYRVFAFWKSVLEEADRFVDAIHETALDVAEWKRQAEICANPKPHRMFDVGFAAFYMNRCNRSGVLSGAGPIGGFEQKGSWRLDVRFNRHTLAERVLYAKRFADRIKLHNLDAIQFLKGKLPRDSQRAATFVYLDPPYVNKGQRLYLNAYERRDHAALAKYLDAQRRLPWVLSYDDSALVRELYRNHVVFPMSLRYALQDKRAAVELIVTPHRLHVPSSCRVHGLQSTLRRGESMEV